jgi:hypothetical protein
MKNSILCAVHITVCLIALQCQLISKKIAWSFLLYTTTGDSIFGANAILHKLVSGMLNTVKVLSSENSGGLIIVPSVIGTLGLRNHAARYYFFFNCNL